MTKEKKVLRQIVSNIFGIDTTQYEILDLILDNYTDKVKIGKIEDNKTHIHGTFENDIVSVEKEPLHEMYDIFYEILN